MLVRAPGLRQAAELPLPALGMLAVLMVGGFLALVAGAGRSASSNHPYAPIEEIAGEAGCRVSEFDHRSHNPPVSGRFVERESVADGSYAGRRPPSLEATIHSLYHGRVLLQYRPGLPAEQVEKLDRLVASDPQGVLLFANQTGMRTPVAATAYLSLMTCPRVDAGTLGALRTFRDRRRDFGQAF
jgi:hypothetical protein